MLMSVPFRRADSQNFCSGSTIRNQPEKCPVETGLLLLHRESLSLALRVFKRSVHQSVCSGQNSTQCP